MPNPEALLKPGMFAVATIDQGRTSKAMLVPARAVIEDANTNSYRVFVIDKENKARLRVVQLAARDRGETTCASCRAFRKNERVRRPTCAQLYDGAEVDRTPPGRDESDRHHAEAR